MYKSQRSNDLRSKRDKFLLTSIMYFPNLVFQGFGGVCLAWGLITTCLYRYSVLMEFNVMCERRKLKIMQ